MTASRVLRRLRMVLCLLLVSCAPGSWAEPVQPKYGPADKPLAVPLSQEHSYFLDSRHPAPDFWCLSAFYVSQPDETSCSAAAVAMVLNGLLNADRPRGDKERNITPSELLRKIQGDWKPRLAPQGLDGRHGVTLKQLEIFLKAGLSEYSRSQFFVERHEVAATNAQELKRLRDALRENEGNPGDFILLHFVQDELTLAPGGPFPHVSPVGAYDAAGRRVLIFDVDREWYEPYWVSDEDLLKAIARPTAAFGRGGFIRVGRRP